VRWAIAHAATVDLFTGNGMNKVMSGGAIALFIPPRHAFPMFHAQGGTVRTLGPFSTRGGRTVALVQELCNDVIHPGQIFEKHGHLSPARMHQCYSDTHKLSFLRYMDYTP
jgi:hypothetical protein